MYILLESFEKSNATLGVDISPETLNVIGRKPYVVNEYRREGDGLIFDGRQTVYESIIDAVDYIHTLYFDNEITGGF